MELRVFSKLEHFQSVTKRLGVSLWVTEHSHRCEWVHLYGDTPLLRPYGVRGRRHVAFWPLHWRLPCVRGDSLRDKPAFPCLQWAPGRITIFLAEKKRSGREVSGSPAQSREMGKNCPMRPRGPNAHTLSSVVSACCPTLPPRAEPWECCFSNI